MMFTENVGQVGIIVSVRFVQHWIGKIRSFQPLVFEVETRPSKNQNALGQKKQGSSNGKCEKAEN